MLRVIQSVKIMALFFCLFLGITSFAQAGTPMSDRIAVEAGVKTEIAKDLALLPARKSLRQNLSRRQAGGRLSGRHCRTLVKS